MITANKFSLNFFLAGLILFVAALVFSKPFLVIAQCILVFSWFLRGDYSFRLRSLLTNKIALSLILFYIIHLIGLLYTSNLKLGWDDIRVKIPLLILPFVFAGMPRLEEKKFRLILTVFVLCVFAATLISMMVLNGIIKKPIHDIRDISIYMSHVRFALLICLSLFIVIYYFVNYFSTLSFLMKVFGAMLILWFPLFLIIMESVTGLCVVAVLTVMFGFYYSMKTNSLLVRIVVLAALVLIPSMVMKYLSGEMEKLEQRKNVDFSLLEKTTPSGNSYLHKEDEHWFENGNPVWIYVCETELRDEWNKRSPLSFDGEDHRKQKLEYTLLRFLASKGLRKDAGGVKALNGGEIRSVENGIPNVNYQGASNFPARISQILWEVKRYKDGENSTGHSVAQRFEFWKISLAIIKDNLFFGVGTGDYNPAFQEEYEKQNSTLSIEQRHKSHNQFLLTTVTLGLFGLTVFLFSLLFPLLSQKNYLGYFYIVFFVIAALSMLTEDTLQTQAGASFFAFFNSFFLFLRKKDLATLPHA